MGRPIAVQRHLLLTRHRCHWTSGCNAATLAAIAAFVGVRPAAELGRLRAARDVVAALG